MNERLTFIRDDIQDLTWLVAKVEAFSNEVDEYFPHEMEPDKGTLDRIAAEYTTLAAKVEAVTDILNDIKNKVDDIRPNVEWYMEDVERAGS